MRTKNKCHYKLNNKKYMPEFHLNTLFDSKDLISNKLWYKSFKMIRNVTLKLKNKEVLKRFPLVTIIIFYLYIKNFS
jgi:hypothetical protein